MNVTLLLVFVGMLLVGAGIALTVLPRLRSLRAHVQADPDDGARRGITLAFESDDLRSPRAEAADEASLDPDADDPYLRELREAPVEMLIETPRETSAIAAEAPPVAQSAGIVASESAPLVFAAAQTPLIVPLPPLADDGDDGPVDFSGLGALDAAERARLLAQLESSLQSPEEPDVPAARVPEPVACAPAAMDAMPTDDGELRRTYAWTKFMGDDAQWLGDAEREVLIRMLRNLHEPSWCVPTLLAAFQEEDAEHLRPLVLEALIHSYHGPLNRATYEYCLEFGSARERELAEDALTSLEPGLEAIAV